MARLATEVNRLSRDADDAESFEMLGGGTVFQGARARRVEADDPPDRRRL